MSHTYKGVERRRFKRTFKNFSLVLYFKGAGYKKPDTTFIKDISKGGLRFTYSSSLKAGTQVVFEIGIPYIAPEKLILEGVVVASKEISGLTHEIRARFNLVDYQAKHLLDLIEKRNQKGT